MTWVRTLPDGTVAWGDTVDGPDWRLTPDDKHLGQAHGWKWVERLTFGEPTLEDKVQALAKVVAAMQVDPIPADKLADVTILPEGLKVADATGKVIEVTAWARPDEVLAVATVDAEVVKDAEGLDKP